MLATCHVPSEHHKGIPGRHSSGHGDMPPVRRDQLSRFRSSSLQSFPACALPRIPKPEHRPRRASSVHHQQTALAAAQAECRAQGGRGTRRGLNGLFSGDETDVFWKTRSHRKPITQKRADFIIFKGSAPLPSLVDRHPLPKYKIQALSQ